MLAEECRIFKASHVKGFVLWKPLDVIVVEAFIPKREKRAIIAVVERQSETNGDFLVTLNEISVSGGKTAVDFEIIATFTTCLPSDCTSR